MAADPNRGAGMEDKVPWNAPTGVRLAETITTFLKADMLIVP